MVIFSKIERSNCFLLFLGGMFHVIFFKEMEKVWSRRPAFALARQCLLLHLKHNTQVTLVTDMDSCWSPKWKLYIDTHRPAFLLLSDSKSALRRFLNTRGSRHYLMDNVEVLFLFQTLLIKTLSLELNCVFISGIEFEATGAFGYYNQPTLHLKGLFEQVSWPTMHLLFFTNSRCIGVC